MAESSPLLDRFLQIADEALAQESSCAGLTEAELRERLEEIVEVHKTLKVDLDLPKALAALRALCGILSKEGRADYPHRLQLAAAAALYEGTIIEMANGEGKTLSGTLAAALRAKVGMKVHISTFNEYLVRRDATWMWPIYNSLGLTVAALQTGDSWGYMAEGGEIKDLRAVTVKNAYEASILYAEKTRFGLDFLIDNLTTTSAIRNQGQLDFVLIDEADGTLIDQARQPLIITSELISPLGLESHETAYRRAWEASLTLVRDRHYTVDQASREIDLTDEGREFARRQLGVDLYRDPNYLWAKLVTFCLLARELFQRGREYEIVDGRLLPIDRLTGRLLTQSTLPRGVHQAALLKEELPFEQETASLAEISVQNFYRQYSVISGMSGSVFSERHELETVYKIPVIQIPTQAPIIRRDEKFLIYNTPEERNLEAVEEAVEEVKKGRPVLIGVEDENVARIIEREMLSHGIAPLVLTATQNQEEAEKIVLAGRPRAVLITAKLAGRGTDIKLDPDSITAGGLHVIVIGVQDLRHENQLRGRAGRRGLPGSSICYVSLFDEVLKDFGGRRISSLMRKLGMEWRVAIDSKMVSRRIEGARLKIKEYDLRRRNSLYTADSVIDNYRKFIYAMRWAVILGLVEPQSLLSQFAENHVHRLFSQQMSGRRGGGRPKLDSITTEVVQNLCHSLKGIKLEDFRQVTETKTFDDRAQNIAGSLKRLLTNRAAHVRQLTSIEDEEINVALDNPLMQESIRSAIDQGWKQFLATYSQIFEMAMLRGVGAYQIGSWVSEQSYGHFQKLISDVELTALYHWTNISNDEEAIRKAIVQELDTEERRETYLIVLERWATKDGDANLFLEGAHICERYFKNLDRALQWYSRALDAALAAEDRDQRWSIAAEALEAAVRLEAALKFKDIRDRITSRDSDFEALANLLSDLMTAIASQNNEEEKATSVEEDEVTKTVSDYEGLPATSVISGVVGRMLDRAFDKLSLMNDPQAAAAIVRRWQTALEHWIGKRALFWALWESFHQLPSVREKLSQTGELDSADFISAFQNMANPGEHKEEYLK